MRRACCMVPISLLILVVFLAGIPNRVSGQSQDRRVGSRRGGEITYEPRGPGVLFDALDPAVKKWYMPQELYMEYGWRQPEYSNYSREHYQRYVNTNLEGEPFYDLYGNYLTRGWLIFDWKHNQPGQFGSSLYKDPRFNSWFNAVTISSDSRGEFFYSMTVGEQIRTTLTPLTFSKPRFNGIQLDMASDKYEGTLLFSRVSEPIVGATLNREPNKTTNATNMMAGRATAQVGDFVKLGATLVNAHQSQTFADAFTNNPFAGTLGVNQGNTPVTGIVLVLSDDSPEDGKGGAALFSHNIIITTEDFSTGKRAEFQLRDVVADPTQWPVINGGFSHEGYLAADGDEKIVLNYDFTDLAYNGPRPTEIVKITFDLVLANDYKIQMWSDRQTGQRPNPKLPLTGSDLKDAKPALFDVRSAAGNVSDNSNQTRVVFDYGLPSANMIYGFTAEIKELWGINGNAEFDINRSYWQYPAPALTESKHALQTHSREAQAWMVNLSKVSYPYFVYTEAFSMDPQYSTTTFLNDAAGDIVYDNPTRSLYEFVDDNDDQDRIPDWFRHTQGGPDIIVFRGWDENNDFVSDFNQNDNQILENRVPDYEEPFFRYSADRPEFLFGIDLNNNNWIDRFENDDQADYPYKRDHRGYNAYGGMYLTPEARVTLGRLREESIESDRRNYATYGMIAFDRDFARFGRLRFFNMAPKVKDNIVDDRREPTAFVRTASLANVQDVLPARDTWINSSYLQFGYKPTGDINILNKVKYDLYEQLGHAYQEADGPILNERTHFFGVINKIDYTRRFGDLVVQPKFKSEYLSQTAFVQDGDDRKEWTGTGFLLLKHPLMNRTVVEGGVEFSLFRDLVIDEDELLTNGPAQATEDYRNLVLGLQWSTFGDYQGYKLTTQFGFSFTSKWSEVIRPGERGLERANEKQTTTTSFITVYAGVQ
ncbi:MAG: hypothetical protein IT369_23005 [Candidatus Latescibacteria bacterium]|nr:hypothetical protein [Candidatus Latescibacterota bacterium]